MHHQTDLRGAPEHGSEHTRCWRPGPPRRSSHRWGGPRPRRRPRAPPSSPPAFPPSTSPCPRAPPSRPWTRARRTPSTPGPRSRSTTRSTITTTPPPPPPSAVTSAPPRSRAAALYTWTLAKKPYQIKARRVQAGARHGVRKTWILLANYADMSLMRNKARLRPGRQPGAARLPTRAGSTCGSTASTAATTSSPRRSR